MTFPERHHGMTQRAIGASRPGPEPEGASAGAIVAVAVGLLGAITLALVAVRLLEPSMAQHHPRLEEPGATTPYARDWVHPGTDLEAVQIRAERLLTTTEWIDGEAGIARIDIDTAMRLLIDQDRP